MKLTKSRLQKIIKEELANIIEGGPYRSPGNPFGTQPDEDPRQSEDPRHAQELEMTLNALSNEKNVSDIMGDVIAHFKIDTEQAIKFLEAYLEQPS